MGLHVRRASVCNRLLDKRADAQQLPVAAAAGIERDAERGPLCI
jgi:hypothetical protein